jgi:ElaB/YqjD/DUF883 family membrane-anchored ribosome-binding protein
VNLVNRGKVQILPDATGIPPGIKKLLSSQQLFLLDRNDVPYQTIYFSQQKLTMMEENKSTQATDAEKQSWTDKAQDTLQDLKAKASEYADKAEDKLEELKDKAEDKFEELKDKAEDVVDDLKEKASGLWDKVKDKFDGSDEPAKKNPDV